MKKALEINAQRQHARIQEWKDEIRENQTKGEWIYAHFDVVEELLRALHRATHQNVSPQEIEKKIKSAVKEVVRVDAKNEVIELEIPFAEEKTSE